MLVQIEISPGELLDRIAILEIKQRRLVEASKRANVTSELDRLKQVQDRALSLDDDLRRLCIELEQINDEIWVLTDRVYEGRRQGPVDGRLAELCLRAFDLNRVRAQIKRRIDDRLGSSILEEKNYGDIVNA